jgi:hypothetical protein
LAKKINFFPALLMLLLDLGWICEDPESRINLLNWIYTAQTDGNVGFEHESEDNKSIGSL